MENFQRSVYWIWKYLNKACFVVMKMPKMLLTQDGEREKNSYALDESQSKKKNCLWWSGNEQWAFFLLLPNLSIGNMCSMS